MPSKDSCCFDFTLKCGVDRHHFNEESVCIDGHPGDRCGDAPLMLPRTCHDSDEKLLFQCCDGSFIGFQNWASLNWQKCGSLEDKRVDFNYCPGTESRGGSSHLNFVTICIIVTVVIIFFGLAFVIFKRLRYQNRASSSSASSATSPNGRGPRSAPPPRGGVGRPPPSGGRPPPGSGPERSFGRAPSVSGDDLAPPSYEEAILLADRPPAFDKIT